MCYDHEKEEKGLTPLFMLLKGKKVLHLAMALFSHFCFGSFLPSEGGYLALFFLARREVYTRRFCFLNIASN